MNLIKSLFRTKAVNNTQNNQKEGLKRCLSVFDLTLLGIGAIIGAGIFVLTGIAAATHAGPAIVLSYILAGLACGFSALSYAELATSIGGCGSAYSYSYVGLGEIVAWLIGWDLLLEYSISCSAVAIGWSGYVNNALTTIGIHLPHALMANPFDGGIINLPAVFIILLICALLSVGLRKSVLANKVLVAIKLVIIVLFIGLAMFHFNPQVNWHPFMPFGWEGIVKGAGLVFFAYIGFDAVSTAAEESINPRRDLPISIIGSLLICTILYILVAALLTAAVPYTHLNVSSPVSYALLQMGYRLGGGIIAAGAIVGLTTAILTMYYGLTRIFLAIARDGLLPAVFAAIHPKTQTPLRIIMLSGGIIAIIAGVMPIQNIAELVNIGTLSAFALVCIGVIWMRYKKPNIKRSFKTPFSPLIPILGASFCFYLIANLNPIVWRNFFIWMSLGLIIYFVYGRSRSLLNSNCSAKDL